MLWAPKPIATPTTPALASSGARLMPRSPRMTTLGDREDGDRRHAPQDRPEGANALLAALVDQGPLGVGGGAVDLALGGLGGLGGLAGLRHHPAGRRRAQGRRVGDVRLGSGRAPPPPHQPARRPPGRRRAVAQVRQDGVGRPLGQPVDHPVDDELDDEREHHHEDDPQQQVDRPVEELGRQLRRVLVVRQVPDQLAGHARIGGAAGEQRRRSGIHAERRYLNTDHHADPSRDPIRNYATPARLPAPRDLRGEAPAMTAVFASG